MRRKISLISLHHANRSPHIVAICLTLIFFLTLYSFLRITFEVPVYEEKKEIKSYFVSNANQLFLPTTVGYDIFVNPDAKTGYSTMLPVETNDLTRQFEPDLAPLNMPLTSIASPFLDSQITLESRFFPFFSPDVQEVKPHYVTTHYPILLLNGKTKINFEFTTTDSVHGSTVLLIRPPEKNRIWPRIQIEQESSSNAIDQAAIRYILSQWSTYYSTLIKEPCVLNIYWSEGGHDV